MATLLERHDFADARAWETWLADNHATSEGVSLAIAKKTSAHTSVSHPDALDVALCYGWIDGQRNALDDDHFLQNFGPRRARSIWSKINREKVTALIEAGRMMPPGEAEIERAKADVRWEAAYAGSRAIEVPDDLAAALAANPAALAMFGTLTSQNRYAVLFRIQTMKRAETRARKITDFVAMLARGETVYPQR